MISHLVSFSLSRFSFSLSFRGPGCHSFWCSWGTTVIYFQQYATESGVLGARLHSPSVLRVFFEPENHLFRFSLTINLTGFPGARISITCFSLGIFYWFLIATVFPGARLSNLVFQEPRCSSPGVLWFTWDQNFTLLFIWSPYIFQLMFLRFLFIYFMNLIKPA